MRRILACSLLLVCRLAVGQTSLLPSDPLSCFTMSAPAGAGDMSIVDVQGQPFTRAMHIRTLATSANPWDIRPRCFNTQPAKQNDTVLATFWMRTTKSAGGKGYTTFVIEKGADPYTKSVSWTATAGSDWKKFTVPFNMAENYTGQTSAATYNVSFWVTFDPQEIEIGGFTLVDYGQNVPWSQLPLVNWPYDGHDLDAPWRTQAAAQIDKYRKGDIVVVARDANGEPVANADVHVKMTKHAFGFGTALAAEGIMDNSADGQKYRDTFLQNFNKMVFENDLKWPPWEQWPRSRTMAAMDWLDQNGIAMKRGHNLIWPGLSNLPTDVANMVTAGNKDALRTRINNHFDDELGATKGRLTEWDVVNEPVANNDVQHLLGDSEMVAWYNRAHTDDPAPKLYMNDYNIVAAGGADVAHQNAFFNILQQLIAGGAPLDGIGVQSHFDANLTPPTRVWEILDRFATLGKDIQVTEFDINIGDEQLQADYTRDFLTATFAHPAIKGFVMWGFWAGRHWLPAGAMYNLDWSIKPNGRVWQELVYKQWWTDKTGTTGADGVFRTRGFLGDYDIEVTINGQKQVLPLTTAPAGQPNYVLIGKQTPGAVTSGGVTNAASFLAGPVAPGEIVTIFGTGFGTHDLSQATYNGTQLQNLTGDTRVFFDGVQAPMIYSYANQISTIVPYNVTGSTNIQVEYLGVKTPPISVPVAPSAPGVFMCGTSKPGVPVVVNNSNGHQISCAASWQPAAKGSILTLFITGEGQTNPAGHDGVLPLAPNFPAPAQSLHVKFGEAEGDVKFAGLVYAGVTQINVTIPASAPSGAAVPLTVTVGAASSQAGATISIQ